MDVKGRACHLSFIGQITTQTLDRLLGTCAGLVQEGATSICLHLSTTGGFVLDGVTAFNLLRALPIPLTTHNVGNVGSIGNIVFLAGSKRLACPHTTFFFHSVTTGPQTGTVWSEEDLKQQLASTQTQNGQLASIISNVLGMDAKKIRRLFRVPRTYDEKFALSNGLIHSILEAKIPPDAPYIHVVSPS